MAVQIDDDEHQWGSKDYVDHWIEEARPRDERRVAYLQKLVGWLPSTKATAIRVLDVGGGYGLLSQQVLDIFPNSTVVLHDYSEPMFEHARQRLAWAGDRVSYVKADLFDPAWSRAVGGPFDAAVSAIAIHNLRDPRRIRAVYGEICPLLKPGGCFLNYDRVTAAKPGQPAEVGTLENQLRWLREDGFDVSDCLWKDGAATIMGGFRVAA